MNIKRDKNFAENGEYILTIDGIEYNIYRDTFQFSYPVWYCTQLPNVTGYTKRELITAINQRIENGVHR